MGQRGKKNSVHMDDPEFGLWRCCDTPLEAFTEASNRDVLDTRGIRDKITDGQRQATQDLGNLLLTHNAGPRESAADTQRRT